MSRTPSMAIVSLQHRLSMAIWREAISRGTERKTARAIREECNRRLMEAAEATVKK